MNIWKEYEDWRDNIHCGGERPEDWTEAEQGATYELVWLPTDEVLEVVTCTAENKERIERNLNDWSNDLQRFRKAEKPAEPKRFEVGGRYDNTDWFTGGQAVYTVSRRTAKKVYYTVKRWELDGHHTGRESFDIETDEDGNEFVTLYEYHGHSNRIYA